VQSIHKNNLSAYLSDWKSEVNIMNKVIKKDKYKPVYTPIAFEAIANKTHDLSVMLRYLDSNLKIIENMKSPLKIDYQAYADAIVFLQASYLFYHILLDTLAGVIAYFYKKNERINLPHSFHDLLKKSKNWNKFPKDLNSILEKAHIWFPEFKERRVDLVHHYKSFLIFLKKNKSGEYTLEHSNRSYGNKFKNFGEIRKYIGFLLCVYQQLIDDLLDHFDTKFKDWYGIKVGRSDRTQTCKVGDMLWWWAVKYGGYKNPDLKFIE
jgi:hypothetical protein